MIPRISNLSTPEPLYRDYLTALRGSGFKGDIEDKYSSRLLCATDNSVYQKMPQAVIFPKDEQDIVTAVKLLNEPKFKALIITGRGGGTGTNGQSLNRGLTLDCSRHMKGTSDFSKEKREIKVQSGVIKDELNDFLKPHGLFFSPELSTSNRATIGGMISNDAAGQGSLKYGRTSTHIKEVRVVLLDGTLTTFGPVSGDELKAKLALDNFEGGIYRKCHAFLKEKSAEVEKLFPKLNRFMTGYDLHHAYDPKTDTLNLARLICGGEGTLGIICGATLDLTPEPAFRELLVIKYENFDSALRHARELIAAGALSVETVDSKVLGLAKKDAVWLSVKDYIKEVPGHEILGVNIVEFAGQDAEGEHEKLEALKAQTEKRAAVLDGGILGLQTASTPGAIAAVYGMRKKSVGLLGAAAGKRKLVPFTEDTVVPPEHLADYIKEFRALLDSMEVPYGMFGHVDTGLMHVRPALDLTTDEDRAKLIKISEEVVKLVKKYGGQMWGEHGRGYRACFGELFFGPLYESARKIKAIFDPTNRLNPGKICVPAGNDKDTLVAIDGPMRGDLDRKITEKTRESFKGAVACNGNGQCFSYQTSALMCPSYRYTRDHVRSPKGYSELMREWLRQLQERGFDGSDLESEQGAGAAGFFKRAFNTLFNHEGDFSEEYLKQTETCLSCKSCKSICPAHVNAADLNSRFLSLYYGRYLRPRLDLMVLNAEKILPFAARSPRLTNLAVQNPLARLFNEKVMGFIDLPVVAEKTLSACCREQGFKILSEEQALNEAPEVLVVPDVFTAVYEPEGLVCLASVIRGLGFKVALLKPYQNGKLLVIRGARQAFLNTAKKQAQRLNRLAGKGISLVGYDPALTICYRDEYTQMLGEARGNFEVLLPEEWLSQALKTPQAQQKVTSLNEVIAKNAPKALLSEPYYLFAHCTERALVPESVKQWQQILAAFNISLIPVPVACCGMAGLHGHIAAYKDETYKVYEKNWKGELAKRPFERCLVTGFSCRSQVWRMEGKKAQHPLNVIAKVLDQSLHA